MADESLIQNVKAPYFTIAEQAAPPDNPDAGHQRVFVDDTTHALKIVNSSGTVTAIASDPDSIHLSIDSEFDSLTEKAAPVAGDKVIIEDSEDSGAKKWVDVNNISSSSAGNVLYTTGTRVDIKNDNTEQTALSFSVPGGTLGTAHAIRVTIQARIIHSIAGTLTVKFKYGATTMLTITVPEGTSTADKSTDIHFLLAATGATNTQRVSGRVDMQDAANTLRTRWNQEGTAAEDSTAAKTLAVTVQWGAISNSLEYDQSLAGLELI